MIRRITTRLRANNSHPLPALPTAVGNWTPRIRNGPQSSIIIPHRPAKPAELARRQKAAQRLRRRSVHLPLARAHQHHTHVAIDLTVPDRIAAHISQGPVIQPLVGLSPYQMTIAADTAQRIAASTPEHKWHHQWRARDIIAETTQTIRGAIEP